LGQLKEEQVKVKDLKKQVIQIQKKTLKNTDEVMTNYLEFGNKNVEEVQAELDYYKGKAE